MSGFQQFLSHTGEFGLADLLNGRPAVDWLVVDSGAKDALVAWAAEHGRALRETRTPEQSIAALAGGAAPARIFVLAARDETALADRIQAAVKFLPEVRRPRILRVKTDVLASLVCRTDIDVYPSETSFFDAGLLPYAVVCTPRSGSTYLCELLTSVQLGRPREHLRPSVGHVLRHREGRDVSIGEFLTGILKRDVVGSVFGTKVISHFLFDVIDEPRLDERWVVDDLVRRFKLVYLYRKDKLLQALSNLRAVQGNIWHSTDVGVADRARSFELPYDFAAIEKEYDDLTAQELRLAGLVGRHPEVLAMSYEDMVQDVPGISTPSRASSRRRSRGLRPGASRSSPTRARWSSPNASSATTAPSTGVRRSAPRRRRSRATCWTSPGRALCPRRAGRGMRSAATVPTRTGITTSSTTSASSSTAPTSGSAAPAPPVSRRASTSPASARRRPTGRASRGPTPRC